jgi:hypothetical protein
MAEVCAIDTPVARKSHSIILQRLASVGQVEVGKVFGKSETWVSRWKSDDSETCARLLAALALKIVPAHYKCYDPQHIAHLEYFAKIGLAQETSPALDWDTD